MYCQLLDMLYPGKVPLSKVNWKAKLEYEFIQNYKILQNGFISFKIERMIEIERLTKAKYQDNLEFAQWFKRFFEMRATTRNEGYDPIARRNGAAIDFSFADKVVVPKTRTQIVTHNPPNTKKISLAPKKSDSKENYASVPMKKICVEEKKKPENEKNILGKIENILKDSQKDEPEKLNEIYEIFGMKKNIEKSSQMQIE